MSRIGRIHDDYLDPDKHLWPAEGEEPEEPIKCNRCGRELEPEHQQGNPCSDPKFNYLDRGYCSCLCEAFDLRDELIAQGLFTDEQGLDYYKLNQLIQKEKK